MGISDLLITKSRIIAEAARKGDDQMEKQEIAAEIIAEGGVVAGFKRLIELITARQTPWNDMLNELGKILAELPDKMPTKWAECGSPEQVQAGVKKEKDKYIFFLRLGDGVSGSLQGYIGEAKKMRAGECKFRPIPLNDPFWKQL